MPYKCYFMPPASYNTCLKVTTIHKHLIDLHVDMPYKCCLKVTTIIYRLLIDLAMRYRYQYPPPAC